jgi:hypothetical protein
MKYNNVDLGKFTVKIPVDWISTINEDNVVSIYKENNGVGAFQITYFELPLNYELNLFDELYDFISSYLPNITKDELPLIQELDNGLMIENIISQERKWMFGMLNDHNKVIFFTYNAEANDFIIEESIIKDIIKGIRWGVG